MKTYEVWVEGYSATGDAAGASLEGTVEANSWEEAVEKASLKRHGQKQFDTYYNKCSKTGIQSFYGCHYFDNSVDARKSFG